MVKLLEHYFSVNPHIKSELRNIKVRFNDVDLTFCSDNGVFSKDKIDYGSKVLINAFIKTSDSFKSVLDLGCGYGFIGITLAKLYPNSSVEMADLNERAVHLAKKNIKLNNVEVNAVAFASNIYENVNKKYDVIITNPPIRAGKNVVLSFLRDAFNYLNSNGTVWFVMRKDQGALSVKKILENDYACQIIDKSKGFFVIRMKKH